MGGATIAEPAPFDASAPTRLPLAGVRTVLFAGGFRPAYRESLPWPGAFDDLGFPLHRDGESLEVLGLHFVGVHFFRKRKSSLLIGVGEDAAIVADAMGFLDRRRAGVRSQHPVVANVVP
jgi:putative flavoprotein involved in K+ transport